MFGLTSKERSNRMALHLAAEGLVARLESAGVTSAVTGESSTFVAVDVYSRGRLVDTIWLDVDAQWTWGDRAQYREPASASLEQVADRVLLTTGVLDPAFR